MLTDQLPFQANDAQEWTHCAGWGRKIWLKVRQIRH
jgi:hypothetical protein